MDCGLRKFLNMMHPAGAKLIMDSLDIDPEMHVDGFGSILSDSGPRIA
jgi:hypothetical protein